MYHSNGLIMEEFKIIDGEKYCIKYDRTGKIIHKYILTDGEIKQIEEFYKS